jgi:hypothetical protein
MLCDRCKAVVLTVDEEREPRDFVRPEGDGSTSTWRLRCCEKCRVEIVAGGYREMTKGRP